MLCGSTNWLLFRATDEVEDLRFLQALLVSEELKDACNSVSGGMTMRNLKADELLDLKVPIVSGDQQTQAAQELGANLDELVKIPAVLAEGERIFRRLAPTSEAKSDD